MSVILSLKKQKKVQKKKYAKPSELLHLQLVAQVEGRTAEIRELSLKQLKTSAVALSPTKLVDLLSKYRSTVNGVPLLDLALKY